MQQDVDNIERVQKRAINMISNLTSTNYNDKLKETKLMSLETRRLRADLIEVYKILCGKEDVSPDIFFQIRSSRNTTKPYSNNDTISY